MLDLILATLAMMGLTFAIGFVVAAIIKLIAAVADYFDFYNTHSEALARLQSMRKLRRRIAKRVSEELLREYYDDEREDFENGENRNRYPKMYSGYYSETSRGVSEKDLVDYYYPEDTQMIYLRKKGKMMRKNESERTNSKFE